MKRLLILLILIETGMMQAGAAEQAAAGAATNKTTVITSERLSVDYQRYTAEFEKNVMVVDPNMRIQCDRLNVVLDNESNIKQAIAIGSVKLWHQDKTSTCDKAIYIAKTSEIMLIGNAQLKKGADVVKGDKITFWLNEDRMVCEPGQLIITPGKSSGMPIFDSKKKQEGR